jgi:hypothetical protein
MLNRTILAALVLPFSASADLLSDLKGYYTFEHESLGIVANSARAFGSSGFASDDARLLGGDPSGLGIVPLSQVPGTFRAGTAALACDGAGDYADLVASPVSTAADFSVSVWFKPNTGGAGITGADRAFVIESKPGFGISFGLRAGTAGNTNFQLFADSSTGTDPSATYNVPNAQVDQWHHCVITFVAATRTVTGYVDGVQRYQFVSPAALTAATGVNTGTYRSADGRWFKGFIDEEVFWQRKLDVTEVTALFGGGNTSQSFATISADPANQALRIGLTAYYAFDSEVERQVANDAVALGASGFPGDSATLHGDFFSPDNVAQPLTNDPAQARSGNGALLCDGVNNYALINGLPVDQTQSFTISAWFKPDTGGAGYAGVTTRGFIYESGTNYPLSFGLLGSTTAGMSNFQLFTNLSDTTGRSANFLVPNGQVDNWHHFLETYDVNTGILRGFVDGVEVHQLNDATATGRLPLATYSGFRLGTYRGADGRWFRGLIDEVAMWQRPLEPDEIATVYALGLSSVPLSTASGSTRLKFTNFKRNADGSYEVAWSTISGLKYTIEASGDLLDWSTELASEIPAAGTTLNFKIVGTFPPPPGTLYDPGLAGSNQRFYRVKLKY